MQHLSGVDSADQDLFASLSMALAAVGAPDSELQEIRWGLGQFSNSRARAPALVVVKGQPFTCRPSRPALYSFEWLSIPVSRLHTLIAKTVERCG